MRLPFHFGRELGAAKITMDRAAPGSRRMSPFLSSVFIIWFADGGETPIASAISDSAGGKPNPSVYA
jgi:hypothetical protein